MNIDAILEKIEADAQDDARNLLNSAREKTEAMRAAFDEAAEQKRKTTLSEAQKEAEALRDRMLRMASLEERKKTLEMKRGEIDQAFAQALTRMRSMPTDKAKAFHKQLLMMNAQGDETLIISEEDAALFDDAFMAQANEAMQKSGKPGSLRLSSERLPLQGGFVLSRDGMEVNCSYDSLLRAARDEMEGEIAAILFPA